MVRRAWSVVWTLGSDMEKRELASFTFIIWVPISDVDSHYAVDPIEDLRPICPNCHAMVHRRQPPLELDDVRSMLID